MMDEGLPQSVNLFHGKFSVDCVPDQKLALICLLVKTIKM